MTVEEMIKRAHENARAKGFWKDLEQVGGLIDMNDEPSEEMKDIENMAVAQKLALISTEIAEFENEAFERRPEAMLEELADVVIRVFDLCGYLGLTLPENLLEKRLRLHASATSVSLSMYRHAAFAVQAHRKENLAILKGNLWDIVQAAHDYASLMKEDSYALRRTIEEKMHKNEQREYRHGASY